MEKGKLNKAAVTFTVSKASKALPYGTVEAIIATEDLDRHNEHMNIAGIETPRNNYKAYYNHSYNGANDLPVGIIEELRVQGKKLIGRIKLAVEEYPFAAQLYKMVQGGFVDSMSIGFVPKEWDESTQTWTRSEFVEASFVAEPANVRAMVLSKGLDTADADAFVELEKSYADQVKQETDRPTAKQITAQLSQLPLEDVRAVLEHAKQSIGALEALVNQPTTATTDVKKQLIKVRIAGKQASKQVENLNKVVKIKLSNK